MKIFYLPFLFAFLTIPMDIFSQEGPGGVGNSTNIETWLDASKITATDNDKISSWPDLSGNGNNANANTVAFQPVYRTNQANGLPTIRFDGTDDKLNFLSNIGSTSITTFAVYSRSTGAINTMLSLGKHVIFTQSGSGMMIYLSPQVRNYVKHNNDVFTGMMMSTGSNAASGAIQLKDVRTENSTRSTLWNNASSSIGARLSGPRYVQFFTGDISEIIVFDEELNLARKNIVHNYLSSKYNYSRSPNLYNHKTTHGFGVIGIGAEIDGSQTISKGPDALKMTNASSLDNGDYLLIGNDNAGFATNNAVEPGLVERWNQTWRADETGTVGTVDIEFFLGSNGFAAAANYVLLIENTDGDFTNGGTTTHEIGRTFSATPSIKFTDVLLPDGAYFTLAEKQPAVTAIKTGNWNSTDTWNCNCIPTQLDVITIPSPFNVTFIQSNVLPNSDVRHLTIDNGATLLFGGSDTLKINGDLIVNGTLNTGNGTISALNQSGAQNFENNTAPSVDFNNLYVNNLEGLNLTSGTWSITNNLQISSGGLNSTLATSVVLVSNEIKTMQILQSMSNAFTGSNYIVQRYISARDANYANLSSPIMSATIAELDDDLILSGVGGRFGNARAVKQNVFYSVHGHSFQFDGPINSIAANMSSGIGYEVWLANTLTAFNGATVDFVGTPTSGAANNFILIGVGWNLVGNPFQAHISYDKIARTKYQPNSFYIYNSTNGSYDFHTGAGKPSIPPGQGDWITSTARGNAHVVQEDDKVSSTSSILYRQKKERTFGLNIKSEINNFSHKLNIEFSSNSTNEMDENDAIYLASPIKESPGIYSKVSNGDDKLIYNSLSNLDNSHLIPIVIETGMESEYTITSENISEIYDNYDCVFLNDKIKNKILDLSVENSYSFYSPKGTANRFDLILSNDYSECQDLMKNGKFTQDLSHKINIRNSNNEMFVDYTFGRDLEQIEINVYNLVGQLVTSPFAFSANGAGSLKISQLQGLNGVFIVQVKTKNQIVNKKIKK